MFEIVDFEAVRFDGTRVAAFPEGPGDDVGDERGDGGVQRMRLVKAPLDTSGKGVR